MSRRKYTQDIRDYGSTRIKLLLKKMKLEKVERIHNLYIKLKYAELDCVKNPESRVFKEKLEEIKLIIDNL